MSFERLRSFQDVTRQDMRYTLRALLRAPALSLVVITTFGLGIGANAAIFSALDRVFLRPPPGVANGSELRRLYPHNYFKAQGTRPAGDKITPFAGTRDLIQLDRGVSSIARVEGDYLFRGARLLPSDEALTMTYVSAGYFDMLGVRAARGRLFTTDENQIGAPAYVAVISDAFWRSHFAGDPAVLGKTFRILDKPDEFTYTIVGIAPAKFEGLELQVPDLWVPLSALGVGDDGPPVLRLIARPRQRVSDDVLASALTQAYRAIHSGDAAVTDSSRIVVGSVLPGRGPALSGVSVRLIPGMTDRSRALLARLGILGLIVFAIALANIASLFLMRAMHRRRELAVRLALGVSHARLFRQLVLESLVLALLASGVALIIAQLTGGLLRTQLSSFRWSATIVDQRVMLVALTIGVLGGVIAGTLPCLFALRTDLATTLRAGGGGSIRSKSQTRLTLLVAQTALCTAVLACGGVFLQSSRRAASYDRGFDASRLIEVSVPSVGDVEARVAQLRQRMRTLRGVESVGRSFSPLNATTYVTKVGKSYADTIGVGARGPSAEFVDSDFMNAVDLRVIAGRRLTKDDEFSPTTVLTESLARELFPDGRALDACVRIREPESPCRTVVGIVRDVSWDVGEVSPYRLYIPLIQSFSRGPSILPATLYVRMSAEATPDDVRRLRELASTITTDRQLSIRRVDDLLEPMVRPWRLAAQLFVALGLLGLLAATTGIYGLVSFDVSERTRELGVRIALGATSLGILRLVVRSATRVAALGVAAGVVIAMLVGLVMSSLMFDTRPWDPAALLVAGGTLAGAALIASLVPALRATRVDPAVSLSAE